LPFPYAIADFANEIPNVLSDDANRLGGPTGTIFPALVARAIIQRYSADSPLWIVSDIEGNSTNYIPLPVAPGEGDDLPVFEPNFSVISQIEFPIGQQPPQLILDSDFRIYRAPGQPTKILINFDTPEPGDSLRCTWSARHLADGSTVPDKDFYAVVDFAASLGAERLASFYVGTGDSTLQADVVQYRSKSAEMLSVAKALRKRYYNHMGIEEGATEADTGPAFAIGNQYLEQNSGVDRMVHNKYSR
jgi:hypothetical protein